MNIYEKNIEVLKLYYPIIHEELEKIKLDNVKYEIIETRYKYKTLKISQEVYGENKSFFIHSKFNPVKEAFKFANEQHNEDYNEHIIYGFGLGYHIIELHNLMKKNDKLYVVENNLNIFKLALEFTDLEKIITNKNIQLIISSDVQFVCTELSDIINSNVNLVMHPASLKAIEDEYFKFVLENWNLRKSMTKDWNDRLEDNLENNLLLNDLNIGRFFGKFSNIPIFIISCGPSLDKNIQHLKEVKSKGLIISVGTSLKPLIKRNIIPDLFIIIDPDRITYEQIRGCENLNIPFIYLSTAAKYTVSKYNGPKLIACNKKEQLKENEPDSYLVNSGGSVATAALDIGIKMGGNPIVLVGQDLSYTNGKHHADGSMYENNKQNTLKNFRKVKGINGEILDTTLGFLSFKYWMERRIEKEDRVFINATEEGAFINGMMHVNLLEVIETYLKKNLNLQEKIKKILS